MTQTLSPRFDRLLRSALAAADGRDLATDILFLSDFYLSNPGAPTPWQESFAAPAYTAYFLPLNYARLRGVLREVRRFIAPEAVSEIWDFGSGPGTTQWALEDEEWLTPRPLHCLERSAAAIDLHRRWARDSGARWTPQFKPAGPKPAGPRPEPGALAVFSYSFLEMQSSLPPRSLENFTHLLIVEPSTRECGRQLMEWRTRFLEEGFEALAPCTHAEACPLLTHSSRDWCHQRVAFEAPEWWRELERALPMKNRTLTYSYLLLSRAVKDSRWRGAARVIGDTLEERGKTRQMICRGPQREFLSWLHRHGEPPRLPHGALVDGVIEATEPKGGELRVRPSARLAWEE